MTVEWHPIAVHFPLALAVTGALALSAARFKVLAPYAATLATVGSWNLCLAAAAVFVALGTGLAAVVHLDAVPEARAAIALHVKWAIFAAVALLLIAVLRGAGAAPESRPSGFFLVLLWIVIALLIAAGYRGGQNVYRYGIGVHTGAAAAAPRGESS